VAALVLQLGEIERTVRSLQDATEDRGRRRAAEAPPPVRIPQGTAPPQPPHPPCIRQDLEGGLLWLRLELRTTANTTIGAPPSPWLSQIEHRRCKSGRQWRKKNAF
jgi:hypothetical protein